jgi:putative RecB family exonuclease
VDGLRLVGNDDGLTDDGHPDDGHSDDGHTGAQAGPVTLSPSGASTFRQCPRRWRYRYVEGRDDPPGEPALRGSFVHRVLEELMALLPPRRTLEQARLLARSVWPETAGDPDFVALSLDEAAERGFRWRAWRSVEGYFAVEDPSSVDVVERERRVTCDVAGVPFVGIVDRTELTADGLVVTDYKTGRRPTERFCGERLDQVLLYAAALRSLGEQPRRARLLYLGSGPVEVEADGARLSGATEGFAQTWHDIGRARRRDEFPARPGPLCAWCPFVGECAEGMAEVERRLGPAA